MKTKLFPVFAAVIALQTGIQAQTLNWVAGSASGLPSNAIIGGREGDVSLGICRSSYNGGVHPGKVFAGKCNFGWGGAEITSGTYDVLTGRAGFVNWIAANTTVPDGWTTTPGLQRCRPILTRRRISTRRGLDELTSEG